MGRAGKQVNASQLAELYGITYSAIVNNWVRDGCPFLEEGGRGREYRFDTAAVAQWREKRAGDNAGGSTAKLGHEELKRRKLAAETRMAELDAELKVGNAIPIDAVAQVVGQQLDVVRVKLLAIPSRAAPLVASESNLAACRMVIEGLVREALEELVEYANAGLRSAGARDQP